MEYSRPNKTRGNNDHVMISSKYLFAFYTIHILCYNNNYYVDNITASIAWDIIDKHDLVIKYETIHFI